MAAPLLIGAGVAGAGIIAGNQQRQRNKGIIGAAYRRDLQRLKIDQADTRQSTNESLNARGMLTPGAAPTTAIPAHPGELNFEAANRKGIIGGVKMVAGHNQAVAANEQGLTSARGAIGPANSYSGGVNSNLTTQFGLERQDLEDSTKAARQENDAQYYGTIVNSIQGGIGAGMNIAAGLQAGQAAGAITPPVGTPSPIASSGEMVGAYGMPVNPSFLNSSRSDTVVGDSVPNYLFNARG